jgi:hypothetical protein
VVLILEGKFEGKIAHVGLRPRTLSRMRIDDEYKWTSNRIYEKVERVEVDRVASKKLTHQLSYKEDGTTEGMNCQIKSAEV